MSAMLSSLFTLAYVLRQFKHYLRDEGADSSDLDDQIKV